MVIMKDKDYTINELFKEVYTSKMANLIPNGVTLIGTPDYEKMELSALKKLAKRGNEKAQDVYARRTSKLGKYLENV
jgi:hypothetical protein